MISFSVPISPSTEVMKICSALPASAIAFCAPRHMESFSQKTALRSSFLESRSSICVKPPSALHSPQPGADDGLDAGALELSTRTPSERLEPIVLSAGPPRMTATLPLPSRRLTM